MGCAIKQISLPVPILASSAYQHKIIKIKQLLCHMLFCSDVPHLFCVTHPAPHFQYLFICFSAELNLKFQEIHYWKHKFFLTSSISAWYFQTQWEIVLFFDQNNHDYDFCPTRLALLRILSPHVLLTLYFMIWIKNMKLSNANLHEILIM